MKSLIYPVKKGLTLSLALLLMTHAFSQKVNKSPLTLADEYFAAGEYYTAAHLYGQYLNPIVKQRGVTDFPLNIKARRGGSASVERNKEEVAYKMAESYRLVHYWKEAAALYQSLALSNAVEYIDGLYWFAVCQRSLGHYDSASESIQRYLSARHDGKKFTAEAQKEAGTLQYIRQQLSRADSILFTVKKMEAAQSYEKGAYALRPFATGQFLVSSTLTDSSVGLGMNPHQSVLYTAAVQGNKMEYTTQGLPKGQPGWNTGAACVTADGQWLYFTQWKKEKGQTISQIWMSRREGNQWSPAEWVPTLNQEGSNSKQPYCTADGKTIYFASDRKGGQGGYDIWYAPLSAEGRPGAPVNAGSVNTAADEVAPFYQVSQQTLVFASNGREGMGGFDLFQAVGGNQKDWSEVSNLGHPVNSSRDDIYFYAAENQALLANALVGSDRGAGCCLETYQVIKTPKRQQLKGLVQHCKSGESLAEVKVDLKENGQTLASTTTNAQGEYQFELNNRIPQNWSLHLQKGEFRDTIHALQLNATDASDLLVDKLMNGVVCIAPVEPPLVEKLIIRVEDVVTVYFDFDKHNLKSAAIAKLDSIHTVLLENPGATLQISGYTDGLGTDAYNKVLSDKRARACANYLIQKGIDPVRISFVSFGACCPVEMELINGRDNPDGRSKNRRALINVKKY